MNDPIRDELHKLAEEFKKLANESQKIGKCEKTTPEQLAKFGLTFNEAKTWLEDEPNFSYDASYHEPQNRRKVTRTCSFYL